MSRLSPAIVFVLGGPGAGKGTQCARLVRDFGFAHLSAGDLLREERRRPGSQYGELIEGHIRAGTIVPVEVTCALLQAAMTSSETNRFLIDGFPRNLDNLSGWERAMAERSKPLLVLQLDCDLEECARRCLARGAAGSGRSDDNEESLRRRFNTYKEETLPIINHYDKLGLVRRVEASQPADDVYKAVVAALDEVGLRPIPTSV